MPMPQLWHGELALVDLDDLIAAGAELLGPARARRYTGFTLGDSGLAPESVLVCERAADATGLARRLAAAAILDSQVAHRDEWDPTTVVAPEPEVVLARWIRDTVTRHRLCLTVIDDGDRRALTAVETLGSGKSLFNLHTEERGLLPDVVSVANALAQRGLGVREVVVTADRSRALRLVQLLARDDDAFAGDESERANVWRWQSGRLEVGVTDNQVVAAPTENEHVAADVSRAGAQPGGTVARARVSPERATWVSLDLSAVADNVRAVRQIVGPTVGLMAVIKANAYGHGAAPISRTALATSA